MATDNPTDQKTEPNPTAYDTVDYWFRWLRSAKKAAEPHFEDGKKAWDEYENKTLKTSADTRPGNESKRVYPIYWASCKTLEPAYYSRTPKVTNEREFEIDDQIADTMCLINERLSKYLIRNSHFDDVFAASVSDFIHADKATTQIVYEAEFQKSLVRVPVSTQDGKTFVDDKGQEVSEEIKQDQQGIFAEIEKDVALPDTQKIYLAPCSYDQILHTPEAKVESEIKDKAYFFCMTQEEAEKRFPGKDIAWKEGRTGGSEGKRSVDIIEDKSLPMGKYVEGWEIYCKFTKNVYWVSEQYKPGFLDSKPDPTGFRDFFPSPPFIIGSKPSKSLYPTPAFIHLLPTLNQLHETYSKVFELIVGTRRRAIVNGASPELIAALNSLDSGEFIAAKDLATLLGPGGKLADLIFYVPVQELVAAISELVSLEATFDEHFSQWFGVPDILRGVGDPVETAAAQQIKSGAAHDRFKYAKKQIAKLARDSIEMMLDLALQVYDDSKIARICGFKYMKPEDQQAFPEALAALKNDEERFIRIDVETDSLSFIDQTMRQQQRGMVVQTITQGLGEISGLAQNSPEFVPTALTVLLSSLEGMEGGREFEDSVKQSVQALMDKVSNPPQSPPPPDYEQMKIQLEQQKLQLAQQAQQFEQQQKFPAEMKQKQDELQLKDIIAQAQEGLDTQRVEIEGMKVQNQAQIDATAQQLDQVKAQFNQALETHLAQVQELKTHADIIESAKQEIRLKKEQDLEILKTHIEHAKHPPINLTINGENAKLEHTNPPTPPKLRKKRTTIKTPEGRTLIAETEELPDEAPIN